MDLPEIAIRVFQYLDPPDLARIHRACRSWHAILLSHTNAVWEHSAARMSPIPGKLHERRDWETWQDVVRLRYCWGVVLPWMADRSKAVGDAAITVSTTVAGIKMDNHKVTVMDSYGSGRYDCVNTQQTGRHVFFTETQSKTCCAVDISEDSDSPRGVVQVIEPSTTTPRWRLQRACHSDLVPCHEGKGWISFWYADSRTCAGRVRAIEDEYCQGQLYGRSYACFNPNWSDDEADHADASHAVRMWDLTNPEKPSIKWEAKFAAHIVDVAHNGMLVAVAYGSLLENDDETDNDDTETVGRGDSESVFGVEFRSCETGELIRQCPDSNWQDIIFLFCTRTHCLCVRAPEDGQVVTIIDLATGLVVAEVDLMNTFTKQYGGLHVNEDETLLMLWSSSNKLAVLDLLTGTSVIATRSDDEDLFVTWRRGVWVVVERDTATEGLHADGRRFAVQWKALAANEEIQSYQAM
ncbi:hypothetical protein HDU86_005446 [Geranomyces michiganensis]|nr:hypothetical protein HDU86_005446 [Geranomyces michiganensis]